MTRRLNSRLSKLEDELEENARLKRYGLKNIGGRVFIVDMNQALTQCRAFMGRIQSEVVKKYQNEHGNIVHEDVHRVLHELEERTREEGYGLTQVEAIYWYYQKNGKEMINFRVNAQSIGMWPEDLT